MNDIFRIILRSFFTIIFIFFSLQLSVGQAQTTNDETLIRYKDLANIDPLNIRIKEFYSEEFNDMKMTADMAYSMKDYLKAAQMYLYIVNKNSDDCESYYQIACCYAKMDIASYAMDFLIMAINAGYNNFEKIKKEEAFELLKNDINMKSGFDELEQYGRNYGKITYFKVTKLEKCRIYLPVNFDPDKEYPLIIGLHGNGGNSLEFSMLWNEINDLNVIYAVPESPYNYSSNGGALTQQYSWAILSRDRNLREISDPLMTKYISEIASGIRSDYRISSTILLGFSQGAAFAYAAGIKYHDNFDGLICFGGRLPSVEEYPWFLSAKELEENNDLNIFVGHGNIDNAVNVTEGRRSSRTLKKYGYNIKFRLFEGGHYVPGEILAEAIKWIQQAD